MMAKRRSTRSKKRKTAPSRRRPALRAELTKAALALAVLLAVVVGAALLARVLLSPQTKTAPPATRTSPSPSKQNRHPVVAPLPAHSDPIPPFEIFPDPDLPPALPLPGDRKPVPGGRPRVVIIIDDLGYDFRLAERFLLLDSALTVSVLPHSPFSRKIAQSAQDKGMEVMLHLPMEPKEYPRIDPGPGALVSTMTPDELIGRLDEDLQAVPGVRGVNNHMGSRLTQDADRMNQIFSILKQRGLFYIDSRTTAETVAPQAARLFHVPFAQRDVFIDHAEAPERIRQQIQSLIRHAEAHGIGIGIAHPHEETYQVLQEVLPELKKRAELVPASRIVHIPG
jgi:polysaccharide deacetylase 2 family uncharacterized protein YibQ